MTTLTRRPDDHSASDVIRADLAALAAVGLLLIAMLLNGRPIATLVDLVLDGWGGPAAVAAAIVLGAVWVLLAARLVGDVDDAEESRTA